ncbi:uncharacterized protein LOC120069274 [Benincasa hispida]|uniref:uncharacterized protein LOC120069274 n=1 Tax=Benincasa hispida TaxID=102211 RepID=UPI001900DE81|nr:uncharacterized protein LOC120069274 [Benincasa hispida]
MAEQPEDRAPNTNNIMANPILLVNDRNSPKSGTNVSPTFTISHQESILGGGASLGTIEVRDEAGDALQLIQTCRTVARRKQEHKDEELIVMFKKVQTNILLLNAIQQIPRYAEFLKELCTQKRIGKDKERVVVSKNVLALVKQNMPRKWRDPGIFTLPYIIGNRVIRHAMLDLRASINVMPYHVYEDLNLNDLQKPTMCIQLANRSYIQPLRIVKDVLLQVRDLIFPVDFYILKMDEISTHSSSTILLGRPFMKTAKTKIDIDKGCLSIKFDGELVSFNMYDAMKFSKEYLSLCMIEVHDLLDDIILHDGSDDSYILITPCIDLDSHDSHDLSLSVVDVSNRRNLLLILILLVYMYKGLS